MVSELLDTYLSVKSLICLTLSWAYICLVFACSDCGPFVVFIACCGVLACDVELWDSEHYMLFALNTSMETVY